MGVNHELIPADPADPGASPRKRKNSKIIFGEGKNPWGTRVELQKNSIFLQNSHSKPWRKEMLHPKFFGCSAEDKSTKRDHDDSCQIPLEKVEIIHKKFPNNSPLNVTFPWICPPDPNFPTVSTQIQDLEAPGRGNILIFFSPFFWEEKIRHWYI